MTKIFFIRNMGLPALHKHKIIWTAINFALYVTDSAKPLPGGSIPVAVYNDTINQCLLLLDEPQHISVKLLKDVIQRNVKKEIKYFLDW